jgi:hypothetical protein
MVISPVISVIPYDPRLKPRLVAPSEEENAEPAVEGIRGAPDRIRLGCRCPPSADAPVSSECIDSRDCDASVVPLMPVDPVIWVEAVLPFRRLIRSNMLGLPGAEGALEPRDDTEKANAELLRLFLPEKMVS